ncbi:hypothetical protein BASA83_002903 [Batrachochytrium salamandrivorans]|nr:hypothetical protein BASA83_002903 [Batrachochytrium salamandrivorans]
MTSSIIGHVPRWRLIQFFLLLTLPCDSGIQQYPTPSSSQWPAFGIRFTFSTNCGPTLVGNDDALLSQSRIGLCNEIKNMLVHHEYPASLEEMMHLVTRIDARLQEHRQERMGSD